MVIWTYTYNPSCSVTCTPSPRKTLHLDWATIAKGCRPSKGGPIFCEKGGRGIQHTKVYIPWSESDCRVVHQNAIQTRRRQSLRFLNWLCLSLVCDIKATSSRACEGGTRAFWWGSAMGSGSHYRQWSHDIGQLFWPAWMHTSREWPPSRDGSYFQSWWNWMPLNPTPLHLASAHGAKHASAVIPGEKSQITVLAGCSVAGDALPSFVILNRLTLKQEFTSGQVPGTVYGFLRRGVQCGLRTFFSCKPHMYVPFSSLWMITDPIITQPAEEGVIMFMLPQHRSTFLSLLTVDALTLWRCSGTRNIGTFTLLKCT